MLKLKSIRTRVLAIVLVPALALAAVGVGAAWYLINEGNQVQEWADELERSPDSREVAHAYSEERRLSLLKLAGNKDAAKALPAARDRLDQAFASLAADMANVQDFEQVTAFDEIAQQSQQIVRALPQLRQRVDSGQLSLLDAYHQYSQFTTLGTWGIYVIATTAPGPETASGQRLARDLTLIEGSMAGSYALASAATENKGLTPEQYRLYAAKVTSYRDILERVTPDIPAQERKELQALLKSKAYKTFTSVEDALLAQGPVLPRNNGPEQGPTAGQDGQDDAAGEPAAGEREAAAPPRRSAPELPVDRRAWTEAGQTVLSQFSNLVERQAQSVVQVAKANGDETARNSWLAGGGIGAVALLAMIIAAVISHRLVKRLRRLRKETLELSERRLPSIMNRLAAGEHVDLDVELPPLNFGRDEVGQIADAFNRAQRGAVAAAVTEAETRDGANAVFLNIAYRSQVVVHRQLEVLDKAEYRQEDPEQLEMLFQLDHLATRERRNAENLIILGGAMPGRQWRNPVPLLEIVRSAVAETEDYARVRTSRLPDDLLVGSVVADVIHLIAELVDNATTFSPPTSTVEVFGNRVGKGVVVEISDQGLGMPPEQMEAINAQLANPPEFGVMGLSKETRLGLFVVGRLAVRTGVRVRLVESEYGGVRAIVLIPTSLLTEPPRRDLQDTQVFAGATQGGSDRLERLDRLGRSQYADAPEPPMEPVTRALPPLRERWPEVESAPPPAPRTPSQSLQTPPAPQPAPRQPAGSGYGGGTWTPSDGRPPLPTRRRQSSLAPQLAEDVAAGAGGGGEYTMDEGEAAERSRDLMSAIQEGTSQARSAPPASASQGFDLFTPRDKREDNGIDDYGGFGGQQ